MTMSKQKERQERGEEFQAEIRRSWSRVPNCWRTRIRDGGSGTRPADEIVLLEDVNILAEHKRTAGDRFELSFLRPNQIEGLLKFQGTLKRNCGLVFVSFLNERLKRYFAFTFFLHQAMRHMTVIGRKFLTFEEIWIAEWSLKINRDREEQGLYDLKGVNDFCKSQ